MKEKTVQQIENMKQNYTFGVEVEMNNITRRRASSIAAKFFGTRRYENTAHRDEYMTWTAYDADGRAWKFSRDVSIAGPDSERCELITPILEYKDIELLMGLLKVLKEAGAVSNPKVNAGVHVHIARKGGFTVREIKNLVNIMAAHETQIGRAIRIDEGRTHRYCRTVSPDFLSLMQARNPQTQEELEDCWYMGNHADYAREHHYNESRYHMINLHSLFNGHGTVEMRLFQFSEDNGIDCEEMKAFIQLCLGMCELANEVKFASARPQQRENEKYSLRCWLLRLGFIGDEFKSARAILLRHIDGNSAWRRGK